MDFFSLKRWIHLAVIVTVVLAGCWASVRTTRAEDNHGRDRERERHSVRPARDPGVREGMAFTVGPDDFEEVDVVEDGLGPMVFRIPTPVFGDAAR